MDQNSLHVEQIWYLKVSMLFMCANLSLMLFQGDLNDLGKLLMQGSFNVWTDHKKGHSKVKDLARFKPMQRHLFLYHKMLLFCKKREETSDGHEKSPSYSFKHSLKVGPTHQRFVHGSNQMVNIWLYRMSLLSYPEGIFCPWTTWQLPICSKFSFIFRTNIWHLDYDIRHE